MQAASLFLLTLSPLVACASQQAMAGGSSARASRVEHVEDADATAWSAPPLEAAVSIRDGHDRGELSFEELLDRLEEADVVFLGETHVDETTHRFELAVYEELLARRDGRVVLALEMFQRDVQEELDLYVAGRIDEAELLERSRPWKQYVSAYRPLIERARAEGLPVVGSNFPRPLLRRIAMEGPGVLDSLPPDEARHVPGELFANTAEYRRRADNAVRGHLGMMPRDDDDPERLYGTQTLWDNAMGDACARALEEHPGSAVLHVNGYFHSSHWDGTVRQLKLRQPEAKVLTVTILPATSPSTSVLRGAPAADYVVYAEARATDLNDGTWSVHVQRELDYRLHLPPEANEDALVPLLVWLSDDGSSSRDGMALWKDRLGDEAAIAVLEAPYRETQEDLAEGGRWFWPETFPEDIGVMDTAVERIWGYLLRRFPVDPERVCLAGEGTGATVVAAVSLLNERVSAWAVAHTPRRYAKIKDFPLPLPEDRGEDVPPDKSLRLLVEAADEAWWTKELEEYATVGFEADMTLATGDVWRREVESENALREALGLDARTPPPSNARRYISVESGSPRARLWSRFEALRLTAEDGQAVAVLESSVPEGPSERLDIRIHPGELRAVPRCPGPFGGTTVIVLRAGAPASEQEAWLALEVDDPLAAESRFHRLRLAVSGSENDLPTVLSKLLEEGRTNALIVPAAFCADAATLRGLKRSVDGIADRMSLHWLPGLGGPGS